MMNERILPPSDDDDEEQQFETGDDVYSELNFDSFAEAEDEGHIYESIADEIGDYDRMSADDMEDE